MPWVDRKLRDHDCPRDPGCIPDPKTAYNGMNANIGSVYECDKDGCQQTWRLEDSQKDGLFWMRVT